ncbi:hypothetical protein GCM10010498_23900 [Streptomyces cavourensis]|nr:hypothetical protein GCM10010498_23900 [Streptomyces cavourensis]
MGDRPVRAHRHVHRSAADRPHSGPVVLDVELDHGAGPEVVSQRGDNDSTGPNLPDQSVRNVPESARGDHPVDLPHAGERLLAVPDSQVRPVACPGDVLGSLLRQHRIQLDAVDLLVAQPLGEQRGHVPGAGADLQDAVPVLQAEKPEHLGDHRRLAVGRRRYAGAVLGAVVELRDDRLVGVHQREPLVGADHRFAPVGQLPPDVRWDELAAGHGLEHAPPAGIEQPAVGQVLEQGPVRAGLLCRAHDFGRLPSGDGAGAGSGVHGLSSGGPPCLPSLAC